MSLSNNRTLTEEEIQRVKDRFYEEIDLVYEDAIARHVSFLLQLIICFIAQHRNRRCTHLVVGTPGLVCFRQCARLACIPHLVLPLDVDNGMSCHLLPNGSPSHPLGGRNASVQAVGQRSARKDSHWIQNLSLFTKLIYFSFMHHII